MIEMKKLVLEFEAIAKIDDKIAIAASKNFNGIFKVNLQTGECDYIGIFPNEKLNKKRLYTKAIYSNNKVYFVPNAAKEIAVYHLKSGGIEKLELLQIQIEQYPYYKMRNKFNEAISYKDGIFMIGCTYPAVIRIDTKNDTIRYYMDWVENHPFVFRKMSAIMENKFYIPSSINNLILEFDMDLYKGKLYKVGQRNQGCWGIYKIEDDFWLSPCKANPILRWNPKTGNVTEYEHYPKGFCDNGFAFTGLYLCQGYINLIPAYANMGVKVLLSNNEIIEDDRFRLADQEFVQYMFQLDQKIYLTINRISGKEYVCIDILENTITSYSWYLSTNQDKMIDDILAVSLQHTEIITENEVIGLQDLIEALIK